MTSKRATNRRHVLPALSSAVGRLLAVFIAISGCAGTVAPSSADSAQSSGSARTKPTSQLIIKLRDPALDPARETYLKELARDTGVVLVYVRPMSGGAHVLRVEGPVDAETLRRIVRRLAERAEVEYAEPDRRMHTMPQ